MQTLHTVSIPRAVTAIACAVAVGCAAARGDNAVARVDSDSVAVATIESEIIAARRWHFSADTDAMDGGIARFAEVRSPDDVHGLNPTLFIRCAHGSLSAYVSTIAEVYPDDFEEYAAPVRVRFDSGPVMRDRWETASDHRSLFSRRPAAFLRVLRRSSRMRFEFTPSDGVAKVASFDVSGLDSLLPRVAAQCGWRQ